MFDKLVEMHKMRSKALKIIEDWNYIDGEHHKIWVIDQVLRALMGCPDYGYEKEINGEKRIFPDQRENLAYTKFVDADWDTGIAP